MFVFTVIALILVAGLDKEVRMPPEGKPTVTPEHLAKRPLEDPRCRWQRAGVGFRRHRFAVWLAAGPLASPADLALARQATASLALSGP